MRSQFADWNKTPAFWQKIVSIVLDNISSGLYLLFKLRMTQEKNIYHVNPTYPNNVDTLFVKRMPYFTLSKNQQNQTDQQQQKTTKLIDWLQLWAEILFALFSTFFLLELVRTNYPIQLHWMPRKYKLTKYTTDKTLLNFQLYLRFFCSCNSKFYRYYSIVQVTSIVEVLEGKGEKVNNNDCFVVVVVFYFLDLLCSASMQR